jgi:hypothetical protein
MYRLLTLRNFPYLLTIIIAIIGFQINYLIKITVETPVVEYELEKISEKTMKGQTIRKLECKLTNITNNSSFKNIVLNFLFPEGIEAEILNPDFKVIPPSALHNVDGPESLNNLIVQYKIDHLQPGFKYIFTFTTKMKEGESYSPDIYLQSDDTIAIKKKSFSTWLVEKQSLVNLIILATLLILLIVYMVTISKNKVPHDDE